MLLLCHNFVLCFRCHVDDLKLQVRIEDGRSICGTVVVLQHKGIAETKGTIIICLLTRHRSWVILCLLNFSRSRIHDDSHLVVANLPSTHHRAQPRFATTTPNLPHEHHCFGQPYKNWLCYCVELATSFCSKFGLAISCADRSWHVGKSWPSRSHYLLYEVGVFLSRWTCSWFCTMILSALAYFASRSRVFSRGSISIPYPDPYWGSIVVASCGFGFKRFASCKMRVRADTIAFLLDTPWSRRTCKLASYSPRSRSGLYALSVVCVFGG